MDAVSDGKTAGQLLSPLWYRVAGLQPRLRTHARVRRHEYRGERWYVLEDRISRRTHRINPAACFIVSLMDGRRTLQQIWDAAAGRLGDGAPRQEEVIQLLAQLHLADVLQLEVTPDVDELLRRSHRVAGRGRLAKWLSPLAIRIPLFDPDRLLERWLPWYRPLFGPAGAAVWLAVVGWGAFTAVQHWDELTRDITHRVLAPENLLIIGLVFPLIKALHEFGHACAVKAWGGEVHEMGIMLLVLMPVPYVDASAANAFPEKRRRVIVGAAGMVVEVFIAALALYLWLGMEPGIPRAVLFNAMLIAGISTVLFNANPLLRFDGYYILADLIEIPNLRQRSQQYLASLAQRWLLRLDVPAPVATAGERAWFVFFAIGSFIYRIVIMLAIAVFVATEYLFIGVLLAIWAVVAAFVPPIVGLASFIAASPRVRQHRLRATAVTGAIFLAIAALVFLVPVPSWTNAQGVIWVPEQAAVRGGADGFVKRVIAVPGSRVRRGDPLIESEDPALATRLRMLEAQVTELTARYQAALTERRVRAQQLDEQLRAVNADLERARERARELVLRSPADGTFAVSSARDLPGRFVKQGELLAYVIPGSALTARVVVSQQSAGLVRARTERVLVKLVEQVADTIPARMLREVPAASDRLPSVALSQEGGGEVAISPLPGRGGDVRSLQTHFEFEIELPAVRAAGLGERVYVRFEHGNETIAEQAWRSVRQLFLRALTV
ncbi:MAG: HlyD family efflux transporter periplasmic adaptor subunit [Burkholderiales bacterium]